MFIDGIKLAIVWFLWTLPFLIVLLAGVAIAVTLYLSAPAAAPGIGMLLLVVLLILVALALIGTVLLLGIIGAVRFARTGSISEGIRISAIVATIRTMGWLPYILSLVIFAVTAIIYGIITSVLSFIPYIGWVLVLIIAPFFSIFLCPVLHISVRSGCASPAGSGSLITSYFLSPALSLIPQVAAPPLTNHCILKKSPRKIGFS